MQCPFCKIDMTYGCIEGDSRRAITWRDYNNKNDTFIKAFTKSYDFILCDAYLIKKPHVDGYICRNCNKIIIDIG